MSSNMKKMGAPQAPVQKMAAGQAPKQMPQFKAGGKVAKFARGGGVELRGKTRGKFC